MNLHQAKRSKARIRIALQGSSGSGKTYSALLLAFGLTGDWSKVAVIDTENKSADLYSDLGQYYVLSLSEPYTPKRYGEAILLCEASGIECIIIDSITHEWNGKGGCLEMHEQITSAMRIPNSFTAWASVTPQHQAFIDSILKSKCHVISTIRSKTEYVLTERNGKQVPIKVGMAPITRDGFEFENTVSLDLDAEHFAFTSKDRTGLFSGKPKFQITPDTGKIIREWCDSGEDMTETIRALVNSSITIDELNALYRRYPNLSESMISEFTRRKQELQEISNLLNGNSILGGSHGTATS
jgi:hypothetical protein